jgi:pyrroloquinoline quinone biosynthesis protein E
MNAGLAAARCHLTGRRTPLFLSYAITYRCTNRCVYCDLPPIGDELRFAAFRPLLDEFRALGLVRLGLTGGEPLLHPDLGDLLRRCRETGVMTVVSTNGSLARTRLDELRDLDLASVSLDGEIEAHDGARGAGSFSKAMDAAEALRGAGVDVVLSPVLNRQNVGEMPAILDAARQLGAMVVVQPYFRNARLPDSNDPLLPSIAAYREAIAEVISAKLRHPGLVASSLTYLRFVARNYPTWEPARCLAGKLFFALTPDGQLSTCYPLAGRGPGVALRPGEVGQAVEALPYHACRTPCYCNGHLENNFLFRFHPLSLIDIAANLAALRLRGRSRGRGAR